MTKSIYEQIKLTKDNEVALKYATSELYLRKVRASKVKLAQRKSIRKKAISKKVNEALAVL